MPIKFRCKHCQQLLGISRSRAAAVVDCPQCGRSLRVPGLDGKTQKLPDVRSATGSDSALRSALSELSMLDSPENAAQSGEQPLAVAAGPSTVSTITESLVVELDPLPVADPVPLDTERESASEFDVDEPVAMAESLSQLAALDEPEAVSDELLSEMREVRQKEFPVPASVLGGIALLLLGFASGWWIGHSGHSVDSSAQFSETESSSGTELKSEPPPPGNAHTVIRGTIQYQDATGQLLPDSGATVLLLPTERTGTIKFDARSLKRAPDHPDRVATTAALSAVGVVFAETDETGAYQLSSTADNSGSLIVISRHRQRPDDVPVRPEIDSLLKQYFDSSSHLCGKLDVRLVEVTNAAGANDNDIQFQAVQ